MTQVSLDDFKDYEIRTTLFSDSKRGNKIDMIVTPSNNLILYKVYLCKFGAPKTAHSLDEAIDLVNGA